MSVTFPRVRVGEPVRHNSLSVFPLFVDAESPVHYQLADEAIAEENLLVEEINEGGSVPELLVDNKSDTQVLFLEGEELIGAKQNRVLNTSVLVAAKSRLKIPVSCVEQGRWAYASRRFSHSGSHSPRKLRHSLKRTVTESLQSGRGHSSDQGQVWEDVCELSAEQCVASPTMAMSDTFSAQEAQLADFRKELAYVEGANGIATVLGDKLVSVDVFDKPATCEKVWNRLLSGSMLEALIVDDSANAPTKEEMEERIHAVEQFGWERAQPVGEGEEFRAAAVNGEQASALLYEGTMVHGSVVAAVR